MQLINRASLSAAENRQRRAHLAEGLFESKAKVVSDSLLRDLSFKLKAQAKDKQQMTFVLRRISQGLTAWAQRQDTKFMGNYLELTMIKPIILLSS